MEMKPQGLPGEKDKLRFEELVSCAISRDEGPLIDLKQELLARNADEVTKAKFIKNVIAIANTASFMGEEGYLIFGITDDRRICGTNAQVETYRTDADQGLQKVRDEAKKAIGGFLGKYISPTTLIYDLKFEESNRAPGALVAYLVIQPYRSGDDTPYCVSKNLGTQTGAQRGITQGQCWIRSGEHKVQLDAYEIGAEPTHSSIAWRKGPYVAPQQWKQSLDHLRSSISSTIDPAARVDLKTSSHKSLLEVTGEFLDGGAATVLVVGGPAASGKSTFVDQVILNRLDALGQVIGEIIENRVYESPSLLIPILLRGKNLWNEESVGQVEEAIANRSQLPTEHIEGLLKRKDLKWLLAIDGVDEVRGGATIGDFLQTIRRFADKYSNLKILLTYRSSLLHEEWEKWSSTMRVEIEPLNEGDWRTILWQNITDRRMIDNAITRINSSADLATLCGTVAFFLQVLPELLPESIVQPSDIQYSDQISIDSAVVVLSDPDEEGDEPESHAPLKLMPSEYLWEESSEDEDAGERQESYPEAIRPFRLGVALNHVYQYLWRRERKRLSDTGTRHAQWWNATGDLALDTDGRLQRFGIQKLNEKYVSGMGIDWVVDLGIILEVADTINQYCFSTSLTKAYFAAQRLQAEYEEPTEDVAKRVSACQREFKKLMGELYNDLSNNDFYKIYKQEV